VDRRRTLSRVHVGRGYQQRHRVSRRNHDDDGVVGDAAERSGTRSAEPRHRQRKHRRLQPRPRDAQVALALRMHRSSCRSTGTTSVRRSRQIRCPATQGVRPRGVSGRAVQSLQSWEHDWGSHGESPDLPRERGNVCVDARASGGSGLADEADAAADVALAAAAPGGGMVSQRGWPHALISGRELTLRSHDQCRWRWRSGPGRGACGWWWRGRGGGRGGGAAATAAPADASGSARQGDVHGDDPGRQTAVARAGLQRRLAHHEKTASTTRRCMASAGPLCARSTSRC
jgi:hypothetical protein